MYELRIHYLIFCSKIYSIYYLDIYSNIDHKYLKGLLNILSTYLFEFFLDICLKDLLNKKIYSIYYRDIYSNIDDRYLKDLLNILSRSLHNTLSGYLFKIF